MVLNKNKNFCYRVCHIENLGSILSNGLCTKYHPKADKRFISIGHPEIIGVRDITPVKIDGYGNIGDYVPFYFTPRSMMLYNIITGYQAPLVPKRRKEELMVLRCVIQDLAKAGQFFFTDGQANATSITNHYNNLDALDQIDWEIIQKGDFRKEAADIDKQRRYQAEFLIHNHVGIHYIESFHVYNAKAVTFVTEELSKTDIIKPVHITTSYLFD